MEEDGVKMFQRGCGKVSEAVFLVPTMKAT